MHIFGLKYKKSNKTLPYKKLLPMILCIYVTSKEVFLEQYGVTSYNDLQKEQHVFEHALKNDMCESTERKINYER